MKENISSLMYSIRRRGPEMFLLTIVTVNYVCSALTENIDQLVSVFYVFFFMSTIFPHSITTCILQDSHGLTTVTFSLDARNSAYNIETSVFFSPFFFASFFLLIICMRNGGVSTSEEVHLNVILEFLVLLVARCQVVLIYKTVK